MSDVGQYYATGLFYESQPLSSKGLRKFSQFNISDGVITGCTPSVNGLILTIGTGYLIAAGGLATVAVSTAITVVGSEGNYIRLKLVVNTANTSTASTNHQVYFDYDIVSSIADPEAGLTKFDINDPSTSAGTGIYEVALGIYQISSSALSPVWPVSGTLSLKLAERLPIGTIPIQNGGTGANTGSAGLNNLLSAGATVLSSNQYGTALPTAGNVGRIFFKKASS